MFSAKFESAFAFIVLKIAKQNFINIDLLPVRLSHLDEVNVPFVNRTNCSTSLIGASCFHLYLCGWILVLIVPSAEELISVRSSTALCDEANSYTQMIKNPGKCIQIFNIIQ